MYAVIFRAQTGLQDKEYLDTVTRMRELAFAKYGCIDFVALTEGDQEIAISYWHSQADIAAWKNDPEHNAAQNKGQRHWYSHYTVQVVKVEREYSFTADNT